MQLIETVCPARFGDTVFGKLDALIAGAMMVIGAVTGFEMGDGFSAAQKFGCENNDLMTANRFLSNYAGGILGSISSGQDIIVRIAVKPMPSIVKIQQTRDIHRNIVDISVMGRHDLCFIPRIMPVADAMLTCVFIDCVLEQAKYR